MRARYNGRRVVRDERGYVTARYNPEVRVTFTEKEKDLAFKRLDSIGYDYNAFAADDEYDVQIPVTGREDADDFLFAWKESKRRIKT